MRQLAQEALNSYGLSDAHLKLLRQAGNTLFRVREGYRLPMNQDEIYLPGQYMLRIHVPGYQTSEAIELELAWLAAMRRNADLPVPEPVLTQDGSLLAQVSLPGIPGQRNCSLLRWLRGRFLQKDIQPHHYRAQGQLMARLHDHAAHWLPPPGLVKRKFDWDGLFQ